ncbi:hypothetical protein SAY86_031815 [Trapa natans]|uniref:Auxilin-related protein 1 n=1 Tax=Trapa natans TaxID=22666 RepID=A0AAN7R6B7_TRANT|nr:hypothetical protein SAY86_031815 [Trapa natans]
MEDFGALTERYGLKPQGKSVPMAASRRPAVSHANVNAQTLHFGFGSDSANISSSKSSWSSNSDRHLGGLGDHLDDMFGGSNKTFVNRSNGGSSFDYDSIFNSSEKSSSAKNEDDGDIFGLKKSTAKSNGDVFASFPSPPPPPPRSSYPAGDLLGGFNQNDDDIFSGIGMKLGTPSRNGSVRAESNSAGSDDFIAGFGGNSSSVSNGNHPKQSMPNSTFPEDPFPVFESISKPPCASSGMFSDPLEEFGQFSGAGRSKDDSVKDGDISSIDELENFAMGKAPKSAVQQLKFPFAGKKPPKKVQTSQQQRECAGTPWENKLTSGDDIESFFSMGPRSSSAPKSRATISNNKKDHGKGHHSPSGTSSSIRKASSATDIFDDFSSMFGDTSIFGEFEEVEGESRERRRARLGRQTRTQQRVAKAVAEMNQRNYQTQQEQEERHRIVEILDTDIKHWAAGKEGNMRALLSSLQYSRRYIERPHSVFILIRFNRRVPIFNRNTLQRKSLTFLRKLGKSSKQMSSVKPLHVWPQQHVLYWIHYSYLQEKNHESFVEF